MAGWGEVGFRGLLVVLTVFLVDDRSSSRRWEARVGVDERRSNTDCFEVDMAW